MSNCDSGSSCAANHSAAASIECRSIKNLDGSPRSFACLDASAYRCAQPVGADNPVMAAELVSCA